ncbi:ABC transporter permease [Burkholderia sp. WSM2232]|uniref:ABC transporter permease n=1 Tax=Burkholderia sp. WSM2232 TaxID=944436 RepID=UPI00041F47C4|nr:ABC transporter permease [Burkholderia sp. WSM2232]
MSDFIVPDGACANRPAAQKRSAARRFMKNPVAVGALCVVLLLGLACAFGPYVLRYDDTYIDLMNRFAAPFAGPHILGTDDLGRDTLARVLMAGRISLSVGILAMLMSMVVGVIVGVIAGFYRGVAGAVLMRIVDAMLCFPTIFLLLTLSAFVKPGVTSIIVLVASTSWMEVARVVEAQVRSLRRRDFAVAAAALGASDARIMFSELLPNAVAPIVVSATLTVAHAILAESYISFLGYGIQPPMPSWGNMLNNAQTSLTTAPWLAIIPGAMIAIAVTSFNFLGDGLREALDPKQGRA